MVFQVDGKMIWWDREIQSIQTGGKISSLDEKFYVCH